MWLKPRRQSDCSNLNCLIFTQALNVKIMHSVLFILSKKSTQGISVADKGISSSNSVNQCENQHKTNKINYNYFIDIFGLI